MIIDLNTIQTALYELDITGLIAFPHCAPADLYDGAAQRIYERLIQLEQPLLLTVRTIICQAMSERFETHFSDEMFDLPAKQILGLTTEHLCPVCKQSALPKRGSYAICDICGWEDDPSQDNDHTLCAGANHPSANQAQMHLWLYENEPTSKEMLDLWKEFLDRRRTIYAENTAPSSAEEKERLVDALHGANSVLVGKLIQLYSCQFPGEQRLAEENRCIEWLSNRKK